MIDPELAEVLDRSGAILTGHFLLSSGRHSNVYVEKFRVLERPAVLSRLCEGIARYFRESRIDLVAGPTTGGIIIAYEVARQMSLEAIYVESEGGRRKLRRGATIERGKRVLIVDDVLTMGTSVRDVAQVVEEAGGCVAGVGVLIDRSQEPPDFGCPLFAAHKVEAISYAPDEVPAWLSKIPIMKPGTRVSDNRTTDP